MSVSVCECVWLCVSAYVCTYVSAYECTYISACVCVWVRMFERMWVRVFVRMWVRMNARMSVRVFVCQCDIWTCVSAYVSAEEYTDVSAYVCSHVSAYFCVRILHRIINKIVSLFARAIFRNFTRNHGYFLSHQQSNSLHTFCSSSLPPPPYQPCQIYTWIIPQLHPFL